MWWAMMLAGALTNCPVERADYRLRGAQTATARFLAVPQDENWTTGLALRVRVAASGRDYWFLPWEGGTDMRTNLAWVREANAPRPDQPLRRDLEMHATDAAWNLLPSVPRLGGTAPAHLLIPDLSRLIWTSADRDVLERNFFDLTACRPSAPGEPAPRIEMPPVP